MIKLHPEKPSFVDAICMFMETMYVYSLFATSGDVSDDCSSFCVSQCTFCGTQWCDVCKYALFNVQLIVPSLATTKSNAWRHEAVKRTIDAVIGGQDFGLRNGEDTGALVPKKNC